MTTACTDRSRRSRSASARTDEDDGYVVGFTIDENTGASEVQIFDAKDIAAGPIGRVMLPCRVPMGFHATWAPGEQIAA